MSNTTQNHQHEQSKLEISYSSQNFGDIDELELDSAFVHSNPQLFELSNQYNCYQGQIEQQNEQNLQQKLSCAKPQQVYILEESFGINSYENDKSQKLMDSFNLSKVNKEHHSGVMTSMYFSNSNSPSNTQNAEQYRNLGKLQQDQNNIVNIQNGRELQSCLSQKATPHLGMSYVYSSNIKYDMKQLNPEYDITMTNLQTKSLIKRDLSTKCQPNQGLQDHSNNKYSNQRLITSRDLQSYYISRNSFGGFTKSQRSQVTQSLKRSEELYKYHQIQQQKFKEMKYMKDQAEMKSITFKPSLISKQMISSQRSLQEFISSMDIFISKRDSKIQNMKQEQDQKELDNMKLILVSNKTLNKSIQDGSLENRGSVFELLNNKLPKIKEQTQFQFAPEINKRSQERKRSTSVGNDLYTQGMTTINKIKNMHLDKYEKEVSYVTQASNQSKTIKVSQQIQLEKILSEFEKVVEKMNEYIDKNEFLEVLKTMKMIKNDQHEQQLVEDLWNFLDISKKNEIYKENLKLAILSINNFYLDQFSKMQEMSLTPITIKDNIILGSYFAEQDYDTNTSLYKSSKTLTVNLTPKSDKPLRIYVTQKEQQRIHVFFIKLYYNRIEALDQEKKKQSQSLNNTQLTFQPKLDSKNGSFTVSTTSSAIHENLYKFKEKYESKRVQKVKEKELKVKNECTFKPQIKSNYKEQNLTQNKKTGVVSLNHCNQIFKQELAKSVQGQQMLEVQVDEYIKLSIPKNINEAQLNSFAEKISLINGKNKDMVLIDLKMKLF